MIDSTILAEQAAEAGRREVIENPDREVTVAELNQNVLILSRQLKVYLSGGQSKVKGPAVTESRITIDENRCKKRNEELLDAGFKIDEAPPESRRMGRKLSLKMLKLDAMFEKAKTEERKQEILGWMVETVQTLKELGVGLPEHLPAGSGKEVLA